MWQEERRWHEARKIDRPHPAMRFSWRILDEASGTVTVEIEDYSCGALNVFRLRKKQFSVLKQAIDRGFWCLDLKALIEAKFPISKNTVVISRRRVRQATRTDWMESVGFLIPKSLREPWLGDLRDERRKWRDEHVGRWTIEGRTTGQLACVVLAAIWDDIKDTIARFLRMS
jgi:hypothetical protein